MYNILNTTQYIKNEPPSLYHIDRSSDELFNSSIFQFKLQLIIIILDCTISKP